MLVDQARDLLAQGEGLTVEFKSIQAGKLGNSVFETVSAFSNRYGGHILMGVADNGTVRGISANQVDGLKRNFAKMVSNPEIVHPPLSLPLEEVTVDGKLILALYVPAHSQPVRFGSRTFDRAEDGDTNITDNAHLMAALYQRKALQHTERTLLPLITIQDLRLAELMPLVRQRAVNKRAMNREERHPWGDMTDMEIMHSAGLIETDPATGQECFNLAAVLLFGTDEAIIHCCPGYVIDCVRRTHNLDRYDDRLMVTCNLIEAFDKITSFIGKHTLDRFFIVDGQRTSVQGHIAFEIVSNILSHQEFASTMPARVLIERDRLVTENWNRPLQAGPIDPHHFRPDPKNPVIAKLFVEIGYADTLGSGVRNLYKYTQIYSGKDPQLIDGDIFTTIIPMIRLDGASNVSVGVPNVGIDVGIDVGMGDSARLVLEAVRADPTVTAARLAESIGITERQVQRLVAQLRERGFIRREGGNRYGKWVVTGE